MTKKELVADMKQFCGGSFITTTGLQRYLGVKSHHTVKKYTDGLDCIEGKFFFIPDIAEAMKEHGSVR